MSHIAKSPSPLQPPTLAATDGQTAPESATKAAECVPSLDLKERRRVPRAIPKPDAIELDADIGWAIWSQAMVSFGTPMGRAA